jgi:hypothetical protein
MVEEKVRLRRSTLERWRPMGAGIAKSNVGEIDRPRLACDGPKDPSVRR